MKKLQEREGKPLGRIVSDLLARALGELRSKRQGKPPFAWTSRKMGARIDLTDREALWSVLDRDR